MNTELTYIRCGDYFIPNLKLETTEERPLNKYGRMRRTFLREHRPIEYSIPCHGAKAVPPSLGDSGNSAAESRTDHGRIAAHKSRTGQGHRPAGLGTAHE